MPTALQYPLERCRALDKKWLRMFAHAPPPRDEHEDDEEDDELEDGEEHDGAMIREPDPDE
jgi:hypothetical protein